MSFVPGLGLYDSCRASLAPVAVRRGFLVGECCVASAPSESPVAGLPLPTGAAARPIKSLRRPPRRCWWGFCTIRAWLAACHRRVAALMVQFPRLVVVRPGLEVVCSLKCRPIRQNALKIGHFEAMGLHFGGIGGCKRVG